MLGLVNMPGVHVGSGEIVADTIAEQLFGTMIGVTIMTWRIANDVVALPADAQPSEDHDQRRANHGEAQIRENSRERNDDIATLESGDTGED